MDAKTVARLMPTTTLLIGSVAYVYNQKIEADFFV